MYEKINSGQNPGFEQEKPEPAPEPGLQNMAGVGPGPGPRSLYSQQWAILHKFTLEIYETQELSHLLHCDRSFNVSHFAGKILRLTNAFSAHNMAQEGNSFNEPFTFGDLDFDSKLP